MRYILLLLCVMVVGCAPNPSSSIFDDVEKPDVGGSDDGGYKPELKPDDYAPTTTSSLIALKSKYIGATTKLTEPMTIEGQVVANDIRDEFTYTIVLEDATAGVEVSVGLGSIVSEFPLGCKVRLVCDDLWIGSRGGTIVIGEEPTGDDVVDRITPHQLDSRLYYVGQGAVPRPTFVQIGELSSRYVSCFVGIRDVRFLSSEGSTFCKRDPDSGRSISTRHTLESRSGERIELFVAGTTDYADDMIPSGYGNVYAIVELYAGRYSLRPIDRSFDY